MSKKLTHCVLVPVLCVAGLFALLQCGVGKAAAGSEESGKSPVRESGFLPSNNMDPVLSEAIHEVAEPMPLSDAEKDAPGSLDPASVSPQTAFQPAANLKRFPGAREIARSVDTTSESGLVTRVVMLQTDFKYPLIRVEETYKSATQAATRIAAKQVAMVADHVLVKLQPSVGEEAFSKRLKEIGYELGSRVSEGCYLVILPDAGANSVSRAIKLLTAQPNLVAYAEPDYLAEPEIFPNDPRFSEQWGLHNTGQGGGTPDADINAPEAWNITTGRTNIIVAVLDSGVDYNHEDLAQNIWFNPGEAGPLSTNGIDDDGNGYIDDFHGWDFVDKDNDPMDVYGHGTMCAGVIGAVGDNGVGIAGVSWGVRIMALRFEYFASELVETIGYAVRNGAKILSNSYNSPYSQSVADMVTMACSSGVLFVASAGNAGEDNDIVDHYPSDYTNANVIAVAMTDSIDALDFWSNYGSNSVHLAAPGVNVLTTIPGSLYKQDSGTSLAAVHVSGAAALLWSYRPGLSMREVKQALLDNVETNTTLAGKALTGGRLHVAQALRFAPGLGMDQSEYYANSWISFTLSGTNLAHTTSQIVQVQTSLGDGEVVTLSERPEQYGTFTGQIWLAWSSVVTNGNGQLEGEHGASITGRFVYAGLGFTNTAVALVNHSLRLVITTPPQALPAATTSVQITGVNNGNVWVGMVISNALTGQSLSFTATNTWTSPAIGLTNGPNAIWVMGSNAYGFADSASVKIIRRGGPSGATNFVALGGTHQWPFTSWGTASTNIQQAIYAAMPGNAILVSNGTFILPQEVLVDQTVTIRSVNGYHNTTARSMGWERCFRVTASAAVLAGMTITGGGDDYGAGVSGGTISNCLIVGNNADKGGGGASGSTLRNCIVASNSAGGYFNYDAYYGYIQPYDGGGGAYQSTLYNCLMYGNLAVIAGGSAESALYNCTVVSNQATGVALLSESLAAGGIYRGSAVNCIVYSNAPDNVGSLWYNNDRAIMSYCCSTPLEDGDGNISNAPDFVNLTTQNFRLLFNSPCINAGTNDLGWMAGAVDLDGSNRISRLRVDMGAYEFQYPPEPLLVVLATNGLQVTNNAVANPAAGTDYGQVEIGSAVTNRLLIGNPGAQALTFSSCSTNVSGAAQFSLRGLPASIPAGQTSTVEVVFTPSAFANYTANFTLNHNAGYVGSPFIINLRALGRTPGIAQTFYVAKGNPAATVPYTNWATAAADIQTAIDFALASDTIIVSNGVYDAGGRTIPAGALTNRVLIYKPIMVQSVNGPSFTHITGAWDPITTNGNAAVRCVWMTNGATLIGFTLTNGATRYSGETKGGGAWCQSTNAAIYNCVITGNRAKSYGGGTCGGALYNCTLTGNSATYEGGGAYGDYWNSCRLQNCTITGNSASWGGGAYDCIMYNSIAYYNTPDNYSGSSLDYCSTTPQPDYGTGNSTKEPGITSPANPRLLSGSPCINAGMNQEWMTESKDIAGQPRINQGFVDIGAYEYYVGTQTGGLLVAASVNYTNVAVNYPLTFTADIQGECVGYRWIWGDGQETSNAFATSHAYAAPGNYEVVLLASNPTMTASATVDVSIVQGTFYVSLSGGHHYPFGSWADAATNIQDAIAAADILGAVVLVSNGVYEAGGVTGYPAGGLLTNRVAIYKPLTLRSLNGPSVTTIKGAKDPLTTNGPAAVRCVWMTNGATLVGFTLTNGATQATGSFLNDSAGGVWCESANASLSNCVIIGNSAAYDGGGVCMGTLYYCVITGNSARYDGGGVYSYSSSLFNCIITGNSADSGGGAYYGSLYNCTITGNSATVSGGGAYAGELYNCLISGNTASNGGGIYEGSLNNCTLSDNSASIGGGMYGGYLSNGIVYYNNAASGSNYYGGRLVYCCASPMPSSGYSNSVAEPRFVDRFGGNFRLLSNSPCVNAGTNQAWMIDTTDLDGRHRISRSWQRVDMGAYEYAFPPAGEMFVFDRLGTPLSNGAPASVQASTDFGLNIGRQVIISRISIFNSGEQTLTLNSWTTNGTGANGFILRGVVESIAPLSSATIEIEFAPQTLMIYTAAVHIAHNATNQSSPFMINLRGQSRPDPAATTFYVAKDNPAASMPYTNWATAAADIQTAIDFALAGDTIMVSNGVYDAGERAGYPAVSNYLHNRISIYKSVAVRSLNGPDVTIIKGAKPMGDAAIRCVWMTNGASLSGFTLTDGATRYVWGIDGWGGGVWCQSTNALVSNCVITSNAAYSGGGAHNGTIFNCTLSANSASYLYGGGGGISYGTLKNCILSGNYAWGGGGGALYGTLNNCTLTGNTVGSDEAHGGGANSSTLNNCIVYHNMAKNGANYAGCTINYSCTFPAPGGTGNITNNPLLLSAPHIASNSPCVGAGSVSYATGTDLDGDPWRSPPAMGCDEPNRPAVGALVVGISASATNVLPRSILQFRADIQGIPVSNLWTFGDGGALTNQAFDVSHAWDTTGRYAVVLWAWNDSNPGGISATVQVRVVSDVYYVNVSNATPASPYGSWATAATNIQDAVDVATLPGSLILVTNGVYDTGGRKYPGHALTNRLTLTNAVTVRSVNGPAVTIIRGAKAPLTTNGNAAVRCVFMANGSSLVGFTLTNGATRNSGDWYDFIGGGVRCGSTNESIFNCIIIGNSAASAAGGASYGTLNNCTLVGNSAGMQGGGSHYSILFSSMLVGNSALQDGGGSYYGTLNNCTLIGNSASRYGGGSRYSTLYNCIVYYNTALSSQNHTNATMNYSCTTPAPSGIGNITNDPQFVNAAGSNYHLSASSPCIDKGNNANVRGTTDLEGNPRIAFGIVDMGAYECQSVPLVGYWAWASGIINGLTNYSDCAMGDGFPNLLKYATGSSPTNSDELARLDYAKSNGVPVLIFHRNTNAGDATMIVQGAFAISNGAFWSGLATNRNGSWGGASNVVESGAGNPVTCRVRDVVPLLTNRFLRLKVTRP